MNRKSTEARDPDGLIGALPVNHMGSSVEGSLLGSLLWGCRTILGPLRDPNFGNYPYVKYNTWQTFQRPGAASA